MTTSDNISAIEKALEGAELAKRECVFAAQEARKANGSDTYPSRVLDKASAVIDGLVSTLLAAARKVEAMEREIADLRDSLSDVLELAERQWANPEELSEIRRARALLSKESADADR